MRNYIDLVTTQTTDTAAPRIPLWNRNYAAWFVTDTTTGFAAALVSFAIPLLALMATNSPALAGVIGAVGMIVNLISSLFGGVAADRHNRTRLMLLGCVLGLTIAVAFTIAAVANSLSFTFIMGIAVLLNIRSGFFGTATEAALKDVVPEGALGRAQAANQGRDAVLTLAAGPVGGALLAVGAWLVGLVMLATQAIGLASATMVRAPQTHVAPEKSEQNGVRELRDAFVWLFHRRDLRGTLLVTTIVNLGVNSAITTVLYSAQQAGHSPAVLGWISAGVGIGMLIGAVAAPLLISRVRAGVLIVTGLVAVALVVCILPFTTSIVTVTCLLATCMLFAPALNAGLMGYFMVATPTEMIGRANAAIGAFAMGAMPLAPLIAGFGLATIGRRDTIMLAAAIVIISALLAICTRSLRSLPKEQDWRAHADANAL